MITQHVHDPNFRDAHFKQVGALGHAGANKQSAITSSYTSQVLLVGVFVVDKPLCCGYEIIKNILFLHFSSSQVPVFAVFSTATQYHISINATIFEERNSHRREIGWVGNVKSAIAIHENRVLCVAFQTFLVGQKNGDAGSVFRCIESHF